MNIINILEGIEKLVIELLLWIIFIPKTLFRIISDPNWISDYVEEQLAKKSDRFENYISPILLFLVSSLVLFIIADQDIPNLKNTMDELKGDRGIFVGLGFLSLPLLFSLATELFRGTGLTRKGIRRILYIQCYYFSPLTLSIFASILLFILLPEDEIVISLSAAILLAIIFILFLIVEVKLIARELKSGRWKAIGILFGSITVILVGGIFLTSVLETGEIDVSYEGEAEEILGLPLPNSGEFSIFVDGYEGSVGNYRLTLIEGSELDSPEGLTQVSEGETFPSTEFLEYGQFVESKITQDGASAWKFNGTKEDIISIRVEPDVKFDVLFDVLDETGTSILPSNTPNYAIAIGYFYILLIGVAVILGFRSLFRNPNKAVKQGEEPQNEWMKSDLCIQPTNIYSGRPELHFY